MSVPFLALCERGHTGPKIEKETWDLDYVFEETSSIVEEYGLGAPRKRVGALRGSAHPGAFTKRGESCCGASACITFPQGASSA